MDNVNELLLNKVFWREILDQLQTNLCIIDAETNEIVYMNKPMKDCLHLQDPEGRLCWKVLRKDAEKKCSFCRLPNVQEAEKGPVVWTGKNSITGRIYKNYISLIQSCGKNYYIKNSMDMTDYMLLSESAQVDELTQILNRRAGKTELEKLIKKARLEKKIVSVSLYDMNELKMVNDTYGHSEGDNLLRYAASVSKQCLGEKDLIFRLSGDEFILAFYDKNLCQSRQAMEDILVRLGEEKESYSIYYNVSFSYGIVEIYPGEEASISDIFARADAQMYIQKQQYHISRSKEQLSQTNLRERKIDHFEFDKEHLYEALSASTEDYIFVGNLKTGTFRYPPHMVEEFGLPGQIVEKASAFWSELIHPHDSKYFLESNQEIADGRTDFHQIEYRAKNVKGEWIWLRCRGKMIRDKYGDPDLFAGMITNLGKKNKVDHMTGLYNRFEFEGIIKQYLVDDTTVKQMGILILDMDSFKNINDLYDRSFGDEILKVFARKISSILPKNAALYRLDGDEFGIVILNGGPDQSMEIFSSIQQCCLKQQEYKGRKYYCTVSAGGVFYPEHGDNYLDLLKYANFSLETAKANGKNRLTLYSPEILNEKERNLELTELLRESIERGFAGFSVYYQPQVDAATGEVLGAEALARWQCPKYGQISPLEFIPLLEENRLIVPFGNWVFQNAASQCLKWCEKNPDFHMSINLSYLQVLEEDVFSYILNTLEDLNLNPSSIILELTETYLMKEDRMVLQLIQQLHNIGAQVAMDDFGVGYSSLHSLRNIPVDIVKIDREFVRDISNNTFNATFIRSITNLCHKVGKKVCLEGVENQEEYDVVRQMGLEFIQGYYFGHPIPCESFETLFFENSF